MLVTISDAYVSYLKAKESRVLYTHARNRTAKRPHLGIVIEQANFYYFVPLSSPDSSDYNQGKVRRSTFTIKRMFDGNDFLGKLLLNNMIPVPKSEIEVISFEKNGVVEHDKYIDLLLKQTICIRNLFSKIEESANILYKEKLNENNASFWKGNEKGKYLSATVDFSLLENMCAEWTRLKTIEKLKNKEILPIEWEFYDETNSNLCSVIAQDDRKLTKIVAILKKDLEKQKYENFNLYEVENDKIKFIKSFSKNISYINSCELNSIIKEIFED